MKKIYTALVLSGLMTTSFSVLAEDAPASSLTGNIGISTDYVFRGITQTVHKPEVSGGVDYTHSSGLYVGTWLSNQTWVEEGGYKVNSSLEVDLYGGYRGALPADFGYDVGLIKYYYPGNTVGVTPDTVEGYLALSWKTITMKYSHTLSDYFIGWSPDGGVTKSRDSNYLELNGTYDLGDGWGLLGHIGHQVVKNVNDADYTDYKVGVTKDVGFGTVTLAYSDTDAKGAVGEPYNIKGKNWASDALVVSFAKSF